MEIYGWFENGIVDYYKLDGEQMPKSLDAEKVLRNEARYWRNETEEKLKKPNAHKRYNKFIETVIANSRLYDIDEVIALAHGEEPCYSPW